MQLRFHILPHHQQMTPFSSKPDTLYMNPINAYFNSIYSSTKVNNIFVIYGFLSTLRYLEGQCVHKLNCQYFCIMIQCLVWFGHHLAHNTDVACFLMSWSQVIDFEMGSLFQTPNLWSSWWWLVTVCTSSLIFLALKINFSHLGI